MNIHKIGGKAGLVGSFALFRGELLRLLLFGRELRLRVARLTIAGLSQWAGLTRHALAGRGERTESGLLRERCGTKRGISGSGGDSRLLLLLQTLGLELVLQVLHVVVGVVLNHGLWRLILASGLLSRRLLAGRTKDGRDNHQQGRAEIHEGLEVLLQYALRLDVRMPQLRLGLRLYWRNDIVFGHDAYPFRVKSIRFLPSSTYPLSMTFGMM
ncbi:MAG: hypothetical protein WDN23_13515 [Edaphobacter sp.]